MTRSPPVKVAMDESPRRLRRDDQNPPGESVRAAYRGRQGGGVTPRRQEQQEGGRGKNRRGRRTTGRGGGRGSVGGRGGGGRGGGSGRCVSGGDRDGNYYAVSSSSAAAAAADALAVSDDELGKAARHQRPPPPSRHPPEPLTTQDATLAADPHTIRYRPIPGEEFLDVGVGGGSGAAASSNFSSVLVPPDDVSATLLRLDADLGSGTHGGGDPDEVVDAFLAEEEKGSGELPKLPTAASGDGGPAAYASAYASYAARLTGYYCHRGQVRAKHATKMSLIHLHGCIHRGAARARSGLAALLSSMCDVLVGCSRGEYELVRSDLERRLHGEVHRSAFLRRPRRMFLCILGLTALVAGIDSVHRALGQGRFEMARKESYSFFNDVPDVEWRRKRERVRTANHHRFADWRSYVDEPNVWYHNNWDPDFACEHERRVGGGGSGGEGGTGTLGVGMGNGPKWVCDPHRIVPGTEARSSKGSGWFGHRKGSVEEGGCLIYSIGVNGGDFDFEVGMRDLLSRRPLHREEGSGGGLRSMDDRIAVKMHRDPQPQADRSDGEYGCEIHVFDPAGQAALPVRGRMVPPGIHYHPWGIKSAASTHDSLNAGGPDPDFKTFRQTVEELGHLGRIVDVLKVDCKMCEWAIYQDWFPSGGSGLERISQILVETHGTPEEYVEDFFETMREEGYVTFHKEASNTAELGGMCMDYAFLKLSPEFFGERRDDGGGGAGSGRR